MRAPTAVDAELAVAHFRTVPWDLDAAVDLVSRKIEKEVWKCETHNAAKLLAMALAYWEEHR